MKDDIEILQSKRKEIIEKKKEEEKVMKEVESVKETVKKMKFEIWKNQRATLSVK